MAIFYGIMDSSFVKGGLYDAQRRQKSVKDAKFC